MDLIQEAGDSHPKTLFSHVFSTTDEGKAELINVVQYASLGVIPVVALNKLIHRFIPEADPEKSSLEILAEILIQLVAMFCGVVIIHRIITYIPTYSGFKYEHLTLTNVILAFLIIVLSIQTKLGLKVNILVDRLDELWNGESRSKENVKSNVRVHQPLAQHHTVSQADYLDNSQVQHNVFPPAPVSQSRQDSPLNMGGNHAQDYMPQMMGPQPANGMLGGGFGSFF